MQNWKNIINVLFCICTNLFLFTWQLETIIGFKIHTKNYSIGNIKSSLDFSYITGILYYVVCESYALQYLLESLLVNVFLLKLKKIAVLFSCRAILATVEKVVDLWTDWLCQGNLWQIKQNRTLTFIYTVRSTEYTYLIESVTNENKYWIWIKYF